MKGIILKDTIRQFGFKDGFGFWFRWSFINPLETFVWLNITHKPYCLYSGWHCKKRDCEHTHLLTKKEIKKHWEEAHKEMERVESGKNGECVYCGDERGTIKIPNPNMSELNQWLVCEICDEVIKIQQELSFLCISKMDKPKRAEELNNRLLEISRQTGKPIMSAEIKKEEGGYKSSSVEFTGKETFK